jgi:hypothetical protein
MAQNILYKGKNKIMQNAPQPEAPKPQITPQEEIVAKIAEVQAATTPNETGYTQPYKSLPGVQYGKLKPEFQQMQDVSTKLKEQGMLMPEQLTGGITPKTPYQPKNPTEQLIMNLPVPSFAEILSAIKGVADIVPGIKQVHSVLKGLQVDSTHAALTAQTNQIVQGVTDGTLDYNQAEYLFNQIETKLIKEGMQVKLDSRYDIASLIYGTTTNLEEKQIEALRNLQMSRGQAAAGITKQMNSRISASTSTYKPGAGGR